MKKILFMVCVFLMTILTEASFAEANSVDTNEVCLEISELAGLVMTARQQGLSKDEMTEVAMRVTKGYGSNYRQLMSAMIDDAYEIPRYLTEAEKTREITDFTQSYYTSCKNDTVYNSEAQDSEA